MNQQTGSNNIESASAAIYDIEPWEGPNGEPKEWHLKLLELIP